MAELREGQELDASVEFKTASGNPAAHQAGSVHWESSDPSVASVAVSEADETKAVITGVNGANNGSVVITMRADGDPDEDEVRDLIATADVVVTQGEAVVAELVLGEPREPAGEEPPPIEEPPAEEPVV